MSARCIKFRYEEFDQANIKTQVAVRDVLPNASGAMKALSKVEFDLVNKKHSHSINVQIICDAEMRLTNVVARVPGSTHDKSKSDRVHDS